MSFFKQKLNVITTTNVHVNEDVCVVNKINNVECERRDRVVKFSRSTVVPLSSNFSKTSFGIKKALDLNVPYIDKSPIVLSDEDVSERKNVKLNHQSVLRESTKINTNFSPNRWSIDKKIYKVSKDNHLNAK